MRRIRVVLAVASMALMLVAFAAAPAMAADNNHNGNDTRLDRQDVRLDRNSNDNFGLFNENGLFNTDFENCDFGNDNFGFENENCGFPFFTSFGLFDEDNFFNDDFENGAFQRIG